MNNQNLLKTYTDNKANLECALYDIIDELYDINHKLLPPTLEEIKKYIGVLASIIQDIDHTDKTLDVINKIDEKKE